MGVKTSLNIECVTVDQSVVLKWQPLPHVSLWSACCGTLWSLISVLECLIQSFSGPSLTWLLPSSATAKCGSLVTNLWGPGSYCITKNPHSVKEWEGAQTVRQGRALVLLLSVCLLGTRNGNWEKGRATSFTDKTCIRISFAAELPELVCIAFLLSFFPVSQMLGFHLAFQMWRGSMSPSSSGCWQPSRG